MKFIRASFAVLFAIVLIAATGIIVATAGIQSQTGYADMDLPAWYNSDTKIILNIGPIGLKPVRWVIKRGLESSDRPLDTSEQVLLKVLDDVQGMQLRVYGVDRDRARYERSIENSMTALKAQQWHTLVSVREDDDQALVMHYEEDGVITGLAILALTTDNAAFINLVGEFDPAEIVQSFNSFE